jgi:STE24 endopeptidase
MATFDAAAATAAYMATLSPQAHAKATAYTQGGHWLLLWGWLVTMVACWIIIRTGWLNSLSAGLQKQRPRPFLVSFLVAAAFTVLDDILEMPWEVYVRWWREKSYGLTSQPFAGWLTEGLIMIVINAITFGVFFLLLYWVMRRAQRWWWVIGGLVAGGFVMAMLVLGPIFIEPIFNKYTPAPPGPMRDAIVALAHKAEVPSDKIFIYDGSKQSNRYTANVSGLFGSARVAMSDVMFKKGADLAQVRGVVGHEMGHYRQGPVLLAGPFALFALIAFGLVQLLFSPFARLLGAKVAGIADPAGLPVIMAVLATIALFGTPVLNTYTRWIEADADAFSMRVANEPDGMARALVQTIEYRASSPSDLEEFLFYDHPSVEHRVRKAMDWKATHPPN